MRLLFVVGLLIGALSLYAVVRRQPAFGSPAVSAAVSVPNVPSGLQPPGALLTDVQLREAADWLLAAVNPDLPQNDYFTPFAQGKLRWMNREHSAGRLELI